MNDKQVLEKKTYRSLDINHVLRYNQFGLLPSWVHDGIQWRTYPNIRVILAQAKHTSVR